MNNVKEQFIKNLIYELNDINERQLEYNNKTKLDICWLVSCVDQQIEKCTDFIETISKYTYCINGYDEDHSGGYTNGKIRVLIEKPNEEKESEYMFDAYYNYCYYIEFKYDDRMHGYCECTPEDSGYDPIHGCCGCGCDWSAPAFSITKEYSLGDYSWEGHECDYWDYERNFSTKEFDNLEERREQEKEHMKQIIENEIKNLQQRLSQLN